MERTIKYLADSATKCAACKSTDNGGRIYVNGTPYCVRCAEARHGYTVVFLGNDGVHVYAKTDLAWLDLQEAKEQQRQQRKRKGDK